MRFRRHVPTVVVAIVVSAVTAGAPAIAHGVHAAFAHNADKVDGKHAVGAGASLSAAKAKLVATGTSGKFTARFIPKVGDADKLDGINSTGFYLSGSKVVDSSHADAADSATNAGELDGIDSTGFQRVPKLTALKYVGMNDDISVTTANYEQIRAVGNFTKDEAESTIKLTWVGHTTTKGTFCEYQLRIDGQNDAGSASTGYDTASRGSVFVYSPTELSVSHSPVHVTAFFSGLSSGDHAVSIWVRANAAACELNRGGLSQVIYVEEI